MCSKRQRTSLVSYISEHADTPFIVSSSIVVSIGFAVGIIKLSELYQSAPVALIAGAFAICFIYSVIRIVLYYKDKRDADIAEQEQMEFLNLVRRRHYPAPPKPPKTGIMP